MSPPSIPQHRSPLRRIDGADKVSGHAIYAGDLRLPGMAIAKVLRSPLPHARIRRIDSSKAGALPGVLAARETPAACITKHVGEEELLVAPVRLQEQLIQSPPQSSGWHRI